MIFPVSLRIISSFTSLCVVPRGLAATARQIRWCTSGRRPRAALPAPASAAPSWPAAAPDAHRGIPAQLHARCRCQHHRPGAPPVQAQICSISSPSGISNSLSPTQVCSTSVSRASGPYSQGRPWISSASRHREQMAACRYQLAAGSSAPPGRIPRRRHGSCRATASAPDGGNPGDPRCRLLQLLQVHGEEAGPTSDARLARNCSALTRWKAPLISSQRMGQRSLVTMPMLTQASAAEREQKQGRASPASRWRIPAGMRGRASRFTGWSPGFARPVRRIRYPARPRPAEPGCDRSCRAWC